MKAAGDGSVTKLRNGRYWVRSPERGDGTRPGLGTYATLEEADQILAMARVKSGDKLSAKGMRFAPFGGEVLNLREEDGFRSVEKERKRFLFHLAKSSIADMLLTEIQAPHIAELARCLMRKNAGDKRGRRKISYKTVKRVIAIASSIFAEAMERGLVSANPCTGVKVRPRATDETEDTWSYLTLEEQRAIATCEKIPLEYRLLMRIAWGTGIRQGELSHARLIDLHLDGPDPNAVAKRWRRSRPADPHITIRFSRKGQRTKGGKVRRVPLLPDTLAAIEEWLELLPKYCPKNPDGLLFPTPMGCRRQPSKPLGNGRKVPSATDPRGWEWECRTKRYYAAAGIELRPGLHWHALRHTCASSLVAGWWGRRWTLEEVKEMLGHSSIVVTQMYAHLGETSLKQAARETGSGLDDAVLADAPEVLDELGVVMPRDVSPAEVLRYVHAREAKKSGYGAVTALVGGMSASAAITNDINEVGRAGVEPATYGLKGLPFAQSFREDMREGSPDKAALVTTLEATIRTLVRKGHTAAAVALAESLTHTP